MKFLTYDPEQAYLLPPSVREVLPYTPDTWYAPDSVKTGYEINFTRYFYKPQPLRLREEIRADILALEKETEGLLDDLLKRGAE